MKSDFENKGYCVIKSAVSNEMVEFISQYALFDEMQNLNVGADWMVPDAHCRFGDPAMETLLVKLQPLMEENTGKKLIPTYSYFRVYRNGQDLKPHLDRDACEISTTVMFDCSYDTNTFKWPIVIEDEEIHLTPGDIAIYKGCELTHWREELNHPNEDTWHVQGFFHYVDANGPFTAEAYDKRPGVGYRSYVKDIDKRAQKPYIEYT